MKKIKVAIGLLLLIINAIAITYINKPSKALALADVDQSCSYGTTPEQYTFLSHEPVQVFVPTKNLLEGVSVYVKAAIGNEADIRLEVNSENHGVIAAKTARITNQWGWQLFEFSDVEMPMDAYGIVLTDSGDLGKAVWMHGPADCYDRGYAIYDNAGHMEFDYRFAVNAKNADTPSAPPSGNPAAPSAGNASVGTTRGTGSTPAVSTSSNIAAPINLTATNESNYTGTGIRLNWSAGNASAIDGYKIFRSSSASGGFTEIGRVIGGVTVYLDSSITIGQTYYYIVRAYKGNLESASSNIAQATAKDTFKEEILNDYKNSGGGGIMGGALFLLARVAVPLIIFGLIFFLFIIGIILLARRRKQNNQNQPENKKTGKE